MTPLVDVGTFMTWPGITIANAAQSATAAQLLAAASTLVRDAAGLDWLDSGGDLDDVPDEAVWITQAVAARVWHNPRGLVQTTAGPFSDRYAEPIAGLELTDTERAILARLGVSVNTLPGIWTLGTTRGTDLDADTVYLDVVPAGEPIPWA